MVRACHLSIIERILFMKVFSCEDQFEAIMTCIYVAWEYAIVNGHNNVSIKKEPILQMNLFDEYEHVDADINKAHKVIASIKKKISLSAYICVYYATVYKEDVLDDIYNFLRVGFAMGESVMNMIAKPEVAKMLEIRKNVGNDIHFLYELTRFDALNENVLVAHVSPKNNVTYIASKHFEERLPSINWVIVDDRRKLAVIHPADEERYIMYLSDEECAQLSKTELIEDEFSKLWKVFFDTIAISQRKNEKCQKNLFPIWRREHVTEFR